MYAFIFKKLGSRKHENCPVMLKINVSCRLYVYIKENFSMYCQKLLRYFNCSIPTQMKEITFNPVG